MKHALAILVLVTGVARADKPSRSVVAAGGWLKAMINTSAIAPMSYDKKRPLSYTVQGEGDACGKLETGKAATQAEIKALKACFVATWNHMAKEAELELRDLKQKDLDGDQIRWTKTAPKGTTWVAATRRYAGQDLTVNMALGADYTVLGVWFVYLENDGE